MIIGVSGKIGSGKDEVAKMIREELASQHRHVEIKKFAGKLKEICALLTGTDLEKWEDREFKYKILSEWGITPRQMLLDIGTKALRDNFDTDVWAKALFSDYKNSVLDFWVITDMRFKNELEIIQDRGITLRIERLYNPHAPIDHISETDLDNAKFDYVIYNDGVSLENLRKEVVKFLKFFNLY